MAQNTATTDAPIHEDVIAAVADEYDIDEAALADALATANDLHAEFGDEMREHHHVVADDERGLLVLDGSGHEWREVADQIDHDVDVPRHERLATILTVAHDQHAKEYESDAFGGRQEAVDATGVSDAILVRE